jgi:hypothetical protein
MKIISLFLRFMEIKSISGDARKRLWLSGFRRLIPSFQDAIWRPEHAEKGKP